MHSIALLYNSLHLNMESQQAFAQPGTLMEDCSCNSKTRTTVSLTETTHRWEGLM